ncbi:MAG: quercetin dioxygenase-like cupin family protein [Rhodothermales bacterium]|jgi:quercetin dioxygenase-like cupin family protein
MHRHPNLEAVVLTDAHFLFTSPDGTEAKVDLPAGTPLYNEAAAHTVSNIGETAGEVILVELKADEDEHEEDGDEGHLEDGEHEEEGDDDVAVDPLLDSTVADAERHTVVFENDLIRVIRFDYAAGAQSNMHSHPEGVVIPLASGSALITLGDGTEIEAALMAGEPYWTDAVVHKALNRSESSIYGFGVEVKD